MIEARPLGTKSYYQDRGGFDALSFLKSPMILMALFSMGLIFGMPYLMENSKSSPPPLNQRSIGVEGEDG